MSLRAWQVCDEDIVGAETGEDALVWYIAETGVARSRLRDPPDEIPLESTCWRDEAMLGRMTYQQAIDEAPSIPAILSSTEH